MSKASVEEIKLGSGGLRGQIAEQLGDAGLSHVEDSENVLLKFHGTYQQGGTMMLRATHGSSMRET